MFNFAKIVSLVSFDINPLKDKCLNVPAILQMVKERLKYILYATSVTLDNANVVMQINPPTQWGLLKY